MVPPSSRKVPRVSRYSGSHWRPSAFAYGAFTPSGRLFQNLSASSQTALRGPKPRDARITVWALSRSLAATGEIDVSFFSSGYLDVSVHRVPPCMVRPYGFSIQVTEVRSAGSPHSDIHGSLDICSSPWLFAAYYVFLRLMVPRHSPCALIRLIPFCKILIAFCFQ